MVLEEVEVSQITKTFLFPNFLVHTSAQLVVCSLSLITVR